MRQLWVSVPVCQSFKDVFDVLNYLIKGLLAIVPEDVPVISNVLEVVLYNPKEICEVN